MHSLWHIAYEVEPENLSEKVYKHYAGWFLNSTLTCEYFDHKSQQIATRMMTFQQTQPIGSLRPSAYWEAFEKCLEKFNKQLSSLIITVWSPDGGKSRNSQNATRTKITSGSNRPIFRKKLVRNIKRTIKKHISSHRIHHIRQPSPRKDSQNFHQRNAQTCAVARRYEKIESTEG